MSNETKNELIKRLKFSRFYVSAHGGYNKKPKMFTVPKNTIYDANEKKVWYYFLSSQILGKSQSLQFLIC